MPRTKPTPAQLVALKKQLASTFMNHPAVAGVGVGASSVRVYLTKDDAKVRSDVRAAVEQIDPGAPFECVTSGPFRAQPGARKRKKPKSS